MLSDYDFLQLDNEDWLSSFDRRNIHHCYRQTILSVHYDIYFHFPLPTAMLRFKKMKKNKRNLRKI